MPFVMLEMINFFRSLLKKLELERKNLTKMVETESEEIGKMN